MKLDPWTLWFGRGLGVELLLHHTEKSQLRWFECMKKLHRGDLLGEVFHVCPIRRRPAGKVMSLTGNSGHLCHLHDPNRDKLQEIDEWMRDFILEQTIYIDLVKAYTRLTQCDMGSKQSLGNLLTQKQLRRWWWWWWLGGRYLICGFTTSGYL